ncbi:MAG: hypothetical protein QX203_17250, partial [Methylococcaceae bacterium]
RVFVVNAFVLKRILSQSPKRGNDAVCGTLFLGTSLIARYPINKPITINETLPAPLLINER